MRLVSFSERGQERPGIVVGKEVVDLRAARPEWPATWRSLLETSLLNEVRRLAEQAAKLPTNYRRPLDQVRLGPPILDPRNIVCVGVNYHDHASEAGKTLPSNPVLFAKALGALNGPYDDIVIPEGSTQVDYEAELAIVIGRQAKRVSERDALDYVCGYMALNDVSEREAQFSDKQWYRGKSFDTFAPCGPWIVTGDEIPDPGNLTLSAVLNGQVLQDSNTSQMSFGPAALVSFISRGITLHPGDIIATGTPSGVGFFREPQIFLKPGDVIEIKVEKIGTLRNRVAAAK